MKKYLFVFIYVISFSLCKAQYVYIPDSAFRVFLTANYSSCMAGDSLDTICASLVTVTSMDCSSHGIRNLSGVKYFSQVDSLICSNNGYLLNILELPDSLTYLNCEYDFNLTSLSTLPATLKTLNCNWCNLTSLPNLPTTLTSLSCWQNHLMSLPALPPALLILHCEFNPLTTLPTLPSSLTNIYCGNCSITTLPTLPSSLLQLWCGYNQLNSLPSLPSSLHGVDCSYNNLTSLPNLPSTISSINCSNCQLSSLPILPTSLQAIGCSHNVITSLPNLFSIPFFGNLDCSYNLLTSLPAIPNTIRYNLDCSHNQITSISNFPDSIGNLYINDNPISCLPEIKKINEFHWENTNIHCLPNIGSISNSTPLIDTLPLCQISDSCPNYNCHSEFIIYPDTAQLHHYFISDSSSAQPPLSYYWSWGDGTHDTIPLPSHVYADSGFYDVCLTITDATGCTSTYCDTSFHAMHSLNQMVYVDVVSSITGIREGSKELEIIIYPNPTKGQFTITDLQFANAQVEIYNVIGEKVYSSRLIGDQQTISKNFPSGIYFVKIAGREKQFVEKLIVE